MISGEQMPTCEIRQTRDVTDAEAKRMSHFDYKPNLLIYIGVAQVAVLPKSACEKQDVESFCVELMRRWHAHRAPTGAPA
jgi:hypothetical protein